MLSGWINIDGWRFPGVDFVIDVRQPLLLAEATCRLIFVKQFSNVSMQISALPFCASFFAYCNPGEPCVSLSLTANNSRTPTPSRAAQSLYVEAQR
jgi:hypothetical protein